MCTMSKTISGSTLVCQNTGANNHSGLHYVTATILRRNYTWRWAAPASSATVLNTDDTPSANKVTVVGEADNE